MEKDEDMILYTEIEDILTKQLKKRYVGTLYDERFVVDVEVSMHEVLEEGSCIGGMNYDALYIHFVVESKSKKTKKKIRVYLT